MVVLAFTISLLCSGCGTGMTVVALANESPTISQVSPQVVTAGTPSVTVTVQGTNFQSNAALMVNGAAVPTTVVNSTTIAANITGTPLAQPAVAQLQVRNTNGGQSNEVALTVTSAPLSEDSLSISTTQLASAQVGVAYKVSLAATGGITPYKWSVSSGSLPPGLTLSSGGVLSGTPTVSGTYNFAVTVSDSATKAQSKTVTFSIVVTPQPSAPAALTITTSSLGSGQVGTSYSASLSANGGTPSYTWSLSSGKLPAGLTLSSAGVISGTPTASGTSTFVVRAKDSSSPALTASANESITVSAAPATLTIMTTSLAGAKGGSSYSASLSASGGTPSYTWSIASGSLPVGLSLSSAGVISGTPTGSGTSTFTVAVKDSGSPAQTASAQESIAVSAAPATLTIMTTSLASAKGGSSYSASLSASGGTPSYTWSIASGSLPAGLSLSSAGVISGTPTGSGTSTFTVAVKDSGSPVQTASTQESIAVSAAPATLSITSTSLASAKGGSSYSATLSASGGTPSYTWSIASGSLPAGLSLSSAGVISGTPTGSGTSTFTVAVKDSGSPVQTASAQESIAVSAAPATLSITTTGLAAGKSGSSYSATLSATGGTPNYTWSISSGSLPAGLSLSSAGVISGTPTASGTATFTVAVQDSGSPVQTASAQESIAVSAAPATLTITTTSLAAATDGTSYNASLSASGGTPGYTWSVSGSLPAGLTMSAAGVISGTPTGTGTSTFSVTVSDSASPSQTASAQFSITANTATSTLTITSTSLGAAQNGSTYSTTLSATGGTPSYTWSVTSGSLPAGLSISSAGVISGTPTTTGTSTFTVTVTDSSSPAQTATAQESLAVDAAQTSTSGTTWYIRPDGGTRFSSNVSSGQCDGQGDQSYAAAVAANGGTAAPNLHCAFNDVRFLWQDGSYYGYQSYAWIIASGDTVIIRGSIADGVSYRIGWDSGSGYCANGAPCFGFPGDPFDSGPPQLPAGTAGHPTRILGGNYGACTAQTARTQLHGGYGVYAVLDLRGAAYVDVECLDITDFSGCGSAGQANKCGSSDDFATYGLRLNNSITNSTFTDLRLHGLAVEGMIGPVGDGVTFTDLAIIGNAGGGWNADDGTTGTGNLLVQNFNISWNGCAEEYPLVDALPYNNCTDDQSASHGGSGAGYGDGFGTTTITGTTPWHIDFENGTVTYNTQDGLDALHAQGAGSTTKANRVLAYGNMGNQIKIGSDGGSTITNNVIFNNCNAMSQNIPGTPSGFNTLLSDFCRADDEAIIVSMNDGSTSTVVGNTIYGFRAGTTVNSWGDLGGIVCEGTCTTADNIIYADNILVGFDPYNTGRFPAQYYLEDGAFSANPFTNPGSVYSNNMKYQLGTGCPDTGESNAICAVPQVNNVTWPSYGYVDVQPTPGSSNVLGAGIALPAAAQDFTGATRPNPPSVGAYD